MSLNLALNTAVTGLLTQSQQIQVASSNIANAGVAGYTEKTANEQTIDFGGLGAGVDISSITRSVDQDLLQEVQTQTAVNSQSTTLNSYYTQLQSLFGTPGSSTSISNQINTFQNDIQQMSQDPSSSVNQSTMASDAVQMTSSFNSLATALQKLRSQADQAIGADVQTIQQQLKTIDTLNTQIVAAKAANQPVGDLEDQRDQAVQAVAQQIPVKYYVRDRGDMVLMTGANQVLVDQGAQTMSYTPAAEAAAQVTYPPTPQPATATGLYPVANGFAGTLNQAGTSGTIDGTASSVSVTAGAPGFNISVTIGNQIFQATNVTPAAGTPIRLISTSDSRNTIAFDTNATSVAAISTQTGLQTGLSQLLGLTSSQTAPAAFTSAVVGGGFQPILLGTQDITSTIQGGNLGALLQMRDQILPALNAQLDQAATRLQTEVNRAQDSGTSIPPLQTLTGSRALNPSALLDPTNPASTPLTPYTNTSVSPAVTQYGTLKIAVLDQTGTGQGQAFQVNLDDLKTQMQNYVSSVTGTPFTYQLTTGDIINAINGVYSGSPPAPPPPAPPGWPTTAPIPAWPPSPGLSVLPNNTGGATLAGLPTQSGKAGGLAGGLYAGISGGKLVLSAGAGYGVSLDDSGTSFVDPTDSRSTRLGALYGLNDFFTTDPNNPSAADSIAVRKDIVTNPQLIASGQLSSAQSDPANPATIRWFVGSGDASALTAMNSSMNAEFSFAGAGALPKTTATITGFAGAIVSTNATQASQASTTQTYNKTLMDQLSQRLSNDSGVSIDQEMTSLVTLQNAYSASARVISTANTLFSDLFGIFNPSG